VRNIDCSKNSGSPDLVIKVTTYTINNKTAKKIGITSSRPDFVQTIILILNYPNLLVAKSFVNGKLSFPDMGRIRTFKTKLSDLIKNENQIVMLNERLKLTLYK
jgi:hypothetical protein